ncbi:MAG: hypothetical protein F9K40_03145 [Kofleriaceae bacterium]|nr:MAG: hypothetical protein F9K40_03145 [Kofleriaceae bacterium]
MFSSCVTVNVHGVVPVQPTSFQPAKIEGATGVAVSVSDVPWSTVAAHTPGHAMPPTFDVTLPEPLPPGAIVIVWRDTSNVAWTVVSLSSVNEQFGDVSVQTPLQPANVAPVPGVSVSVMSVPGGNCAVHVAPQSIMAPPTALDVTVPEAVPPRMTVSVAIGMPSVGASVEPSMPASGSVASTSASMNGSFGTSH